MLGSLVDAARNSDSPEALVVVVEEAGEVEDLPAVLTREVVGEPLQLVKHDVLHVVVGEHWL